MSLTVGAFCMVWRETRFLPLVLEQLERVPGPRLLVWKDKPYHWYGAGEPPSGRRGPVRDVLRNDSWGFRRFDILDFEHKVGDPNGTAITVNAATDYLRAKGADVTIWLDSDVLFELDSWEIFLSAIDERRCWAVEARHYWRNWQTIYDKGNFRIGFPSDQHFPFSLEIEATKKVVPVMAYHPSYVLTDEEVLQKTRTWYHAPEYEALKWYENVWKNGDHDRAEPSDIPLPLSIRMRLEAFGALKGL